MKRFLNALVGESGVPVPIHKIGIGTIIMALFLVGGNLSYGAELSPEATVSNYYNALKNGNFEQAAEYVSRTMRGDKTKKEWADAWRKAFEYAKVVILECSVSPAKIEGDKATVKVKNRSKDKFNSQGIVENEIDHLIKENGIWKIDETEVLLDMP